MFMRPYAQPKISKISSHRYQGCQNIPYWIFSLDPFGHPFLSDAYVELHYGIAFDHPLA